MPADGLCKPNIILIHYYYYYFVMFCQTKKLLQLCHLCRVLCHCQAIHQWHRPLHNGNSTLSALCTQLPLSQLLLLLQMPPLTRVPVITTIRVRMQLAVADCSAYCLAQSLSVRVFA